MDLQLAGKAAVVTGASKGIGLAVAPALAAEGAQVTAGARHFGEMPEGVRAVPADLSTPDGPARLIAREEIQKEAAGDSVTGRFTTPEEVASLVAMVASDRIGNVTGADFIIDGGLVSTL